MTESHLPDREAARLDALYQYDILDTPPEAVFDDLVYLAAQICDMPIALINFIDSDRQWVKASFGWTITELPEEFGFCRQAIRQSDLLVVPEARQNVRFTDNSLVGASSNAIETYIRFYAGMPLITPDGQAIGTLCVMDQRSRHLDSQQIEMLRVLARQVETHLDSRRRLSYAERAIAECHQTEQALQESEAAFRTLVETVSACTFINQDLGIRYVNSATEVVTGYTRDELLTMDPMDVIHPDEREFVSERAAARLHGQAVPSRYELKIMTKQGEERWLDFTAGVIQYKGRAAILGTAFDITERKLTEQQIQASLKEKEILLKEIHHRVKNNLQIISSLLNLQSGYVKDGQVATFKESQCRIKSMALIHEKLYQSQSLSQINFAEYVQQLVDSLFRVYGVNSATVSLKVQIENVLLGVDTAIPCGLILNELVSNCLKHAFPPGQSGEVCISLLRVPEQNNKLILTVQDNGVGFPKHIDIAKSKSLGLQLVNTLAAQLKGTVKLYCNGITKFNIEFMLADLNHGR